MKQQFADDLGSRRRGETRPTRPLAIVAASLMTAGLSIGCGGDSGETTTTSGEDIAAFIEENPEFGERDAAPGNASRASDKAPLGLER